MCVWPSAATSINIQLTDITSHQVTYVCNFIAYCKFQQHRFLFSNTNLIVNIDFVAVWFANDFVMTYRWSSVQLHSLITSIQRLYSLGLVKCSGLVLKVVSGWLNKKKNCDSVIYSKDHGKIQLLVITYTHIVTSLTRRPPCVYWWHICPCQRSWNLSSSVHCHICDLTSAGPPPRHVNTRQRTI